MTHPDSPEAALLALLQRRGQVSAAEIGTACRMTAAGVRSHLVMLDLMRLVSGRHGPCSRSTRRVYALMDEGRRKTEAAGARA